MTYQINYKFGSSLAFDTTSNKVINSENAEEVSLDNLEATLLLFLMDNYPEIVSKEVILDAVWPNNYVQEHSLTRVMSTLRKKLAFISPDEKFIQTVPREGYRFSNVLEKVEPIADEASQIGTPKKSKKNFHSLAAIIFLTVSALVSALFVIKEPETQKQLRAIQHYDELNDKYSISFNNKGDLVAFEGVIDSDAGRIIRIKNTVTGSKIDIKEEGYEFYNPTWFNNELLFFKSDVDTCQIQKAIVSEGQVTSFRKVADCEPAIRSKGITKLSDSILLYTDSNNLNLPQSLYQLDIKSGKKKKILGESVNSFGVYRVFSSPNKGLVATLTTPDWFSTKISVYKIGDYSEPLWQENVELTLSSVGLTDIGIYYRSAESTVKYSEFNNSQATKFMPFTKPLSNVTATKGGFAFIEGENQSTNINVEHINSREVSSITNYVGTTSKKSVLDKDKVYFISNHTGQDQVWQVDLKTKARKQLTNFRESTYLLNLALSSEAGYLALQTSNNIKLYELTDTDELKLVKSLSGINPTFWQARLVLTREFQDTFQLSYFDTITQTEHSLPVLGAYTTKAYLNELYYVKYHQNGVWKFNPEGEDTLEYADIHTLNHSRWGLDKGYLYFKSDSEEVIEISKKDMSRNIKSCKSVDFNEEYCVYSTVAEHNSQIFEIN